MVLDLDPLLKTIPNCSFVHSDQYFSDPEALRSVDFVGLFDTDIFVETSFSIQGDWPLTGAVVKTFNKDNQEDGYFLVTRFALKSLRTEDAVALPLQKKSLISFFTIKSFFLSLPLASLIIFNLFIFLLPKREQSFFFYMSFIATVLIFFAYFFTALRVLYRFIRDKKEETPEHVLVRRSSLKNALMPLASEFVSVSVMHDMLYLKQEITDTTSVQSMATTLGYLLSPLLRSSCP